MLLIIISVFYSCRQEVFEKNSFYDDGSIKTLLRYYGSDQFKDTIEIFIFANKGDTLIWDSKTDSILREKSFYPNDSLKSQKKYIRGMKEGNWIYYNDSGQLNLSINFSNDVLEGNYIEYYESGKILLKGNFKNGLKDGEWHTFDENGFMIGLCRYSKGEEFIGDGDCKEPIDIIN